MATGAAVAAVVGTGVTIYGQQKEAKAKARAAKKNAELKRLQALELLDRFEINSQALMAEGELLKDRQKVDLASRGIDIGSGSALSVIEETNALVARQLILDRKEAEFKAQQLRSGADMDVELAGDIRSAANIRSVGTFLSGVSSAASAKGGS